ncbi:RibD family protein [Pseudanabaena sp. FACHB-1998]|uniref:RibD family protein n=1 Tax=Pseudanabaena sp. FACHB-1998 TaxID=2692858 RepID=UPI0016812159|nr:RibD family protein [Pseudanabaena sp. FACHB-1998]MBD2177885.1 RibD family protein [Pseudanabaena sp. FACHB-1998]
MYNGYTSHDRIYSFEELDFPLDGVEFQHEGQNCKRPYIIFNMVSSLDGKATTYAGKLTGLGSRPDRNLMKRLRSQVDAVLAGSGTLRHDAFIPTIPPELFGERQKNFSQPQPLGMVISNSGNLPSDHRFWNAGKDLRIVLLAENSNPGAWLYEKAQVFKFPVQAQNQQISLQQVLKFLFEQLGVKRLLVEGGTILNYELISQGLADEIFLTLSPRLVGGVQNMSILGGEGYGMGGGDLPKLKLRSLYHHDSELFLRYQFV